MPDHHPDPEQLAAFQAGDGDRRQRSDVEAHLAGCPSCAELVASVEHARSRLAVLEEPELPAGLHDRLAAAVAAEGARELPHRPTPWYRRPLAWGAAAALLLAALVVPLLDRTGGDLNTTAGAGGGGDTAAKEAAGAPGAAGASALPLLRVPGELSAAAVRSELATDARAKQALESATGGGQPSGGAAGAPRDTQAPAAQAPEQSGADGYRSGATTSRARAAGTALRACLPAASAAADPPTRPLTPVFYLQGTYRGRPVTALVTTSVGHPGRVDLWVFPRNSCSSPPLASERVR